MLKESRNKMICKVLRFIDWVFFHCQVCSVMYIELFCMGSVQFLRENVLVVSSFIWRALFCKVSQAFKSNIWWKYVWVLCRYLLLCISLIVMMLSLEMLHDWITWDVRVKMVHSSGAEVMLEAHYQIDL